MDVAKLNEQALASLDEAYRLLFVVSEHLQDAAMAAKGDVRFWTTQELHSDGVNLLSELGELRREIRNGRSA